MNVKMSHVHQMELGEAMWARRAEARVGVETV
jgi:hypothetical protein